MVRRGIAFFYGTCYNPIADRTRLIFCFSENQTEGKPVEIRYEPVAVRRAVFGVLTLFPQTANCGKKEEKVIGRLCFCLRRPTPCAESKYPAVRSFSAETLKTFLF